MSAEAILALISDLYVQISQQRQEIERLTQAQQNTQDPQEP